MREGGGTEAGMDTPAAGMHGACMVKSLQIRNVPDRLHRRLIECSAFEGLSLTAYLRRELERAVQCPSPQQLRRRLAKRRPIAGITTTVGWVREERERTWRAPKRG